jgi:hypothetical protein
MLTGFQAEVIAFMTDGEFVCLSHIEEAHPEAWHTEDDRNYWEAIADLEEASGYTAYSRYALEEGGEAGVWCGQCGAELVEPAEDFCTAHDSWRAYTDSEQPTCEYVLQNSLVDDQCSFPEVDPNPRASRWVPCPSCGAGDGQTHRYGCNILYGENAAPGPAQS